MKRGKKMRGLMCQSPSSTAVCMASETLSVIVSRRPDDGAKLMNNSKYIRLGEHPAAATAPPRRSTSTTKSTATTTIPSQLIPVKNSQEKQSQDLVPAFAANDQVVVMRVSIHCQGCAGKVKKHLSKMEGVTSFSIDLESQRVIVRGHVSPVGVLDSLSKIKRAELWPNCS